MSHSIKYCQTIGIVFFFAGLLQAQKDYEIGISTFIGYLKSSPVSTSIFSNYPSFADLEFGVFVKRNNLVKLSPVVGANLLFRQADFDCVHMAPNGVVPRSPGLRMANSDCIYTAKVNYWHLEIPVSLFYEATVRERLYFYLNLGWSPIITGRTVADTEPMANRRLTDHQIRANWSQLVGGIGSRLLISEAFILYLEAAIKKENSTGRYTTYGLRCRIARVIG